jgi:uncharacterized protein (TIGR03382 family)
MSGREAPMPRAAAAAVIASQWRPAARRDAVVCMRSLVLLSLAAGAALVAVPRPAAACSLFGTEPLMIDSSSGDVVAPTPPVVVRSAVGRSYDQGTCGDLGWIELALASTDDRTLPTLLGFELTLRSGTLPDAYAGPAGPMLLPVGPAIPRVIDYFVFYFDPNDRDLMLELDVRAVDGAGNRSAPTVVAIENHVPPRDDDDDDGGCATSGAGPHALGPVAAALALLIARRRRPRA